MALFHSSSAANILTACTVVAVLIASHLQASEARGQGGHDHDHHDHAHGGLFKGTCVNVSMIESPQLTAANTTCRTRLNLTSNVEDGSNRKNWHCVKACILKELKVITAEDTLSTSGADSAIDSIFPQVARATLKTGIGACSSIPADSQTDAIEDTCGKTRSLERCIMKAIFQACKIPAF